MSKSRRELTRTLALPIRHMDGTGRVTLPHKVRRMLGLKKDDNLTVETVNGCIVMRPVASPEPCPHCLGTGLKEFSE